MALHLDFSLETVEERKKFLDDYLEKNPNIKSNSDLEMCANYLLWGKDPDGKNCVQKKEIEINTRKKTWAGRKTESLDGLMENPAFMETNFRDGKTIYMERKETFSREKALQQAPNFMKELLAERFHDIDRVELMLNYYELNTGKRFKPPRKELLDAFTEEERNQLKAAAENFVQFKYLKLKHFLVELRQEQYLYKDSYAPRLYLQNKSGKKNCLEEMDISIVEDLTVLPLGVVSENEDAFIQLSDILPANFTNDQVEELIRKYWERKKKPSLGKFDCCNPDHLYEAFQLYFDLDDSAERNTLDSTTSSFLSTLLYYVNQTELSEPQRKVFDLKVQGYKNAEVANMVNSEFGTHYLPNYISTIFKKQVLVKVAATAQYHEQLILSLPTPEEFQSCFRCGKTYLISAKNFVRKSRSRTGFSSVCKFCENKRRRERLSRKK